MSFSEWISRLEKAEKVSIISSNCRKIHYKFLDGGEMVEEYNFQTGVLTRRACKRNKFLQKNSPWEVELGDSVPDVIHSDGELLMKESNTEPFVTKRLTVKNIEWRIRNLPYPIATYSVTANGEEKSLTIRTSNKKFFKTIPILELIRCGTEAEQSRVSFIHQHNTLIVTYNKPPIVIELEKATLIMLQDVETSADLDCGELLQQLVE